MSKSAKAHLFRQIPQVEQILNSPSVADLINKTSRTLVVSEVNKLLDYIRDRILRDKLGNDEMTSIVNSIEDTLQRHVYQRLSPALRLVVNATGVIIHTNLGRALLSEKATQALMDAARNYTTLEFDLARGERSSRDKQISKLLSQLLGGEAATVVNNNAAAVFLILNTLAFQKEVIVSRGELIEIGGSFRIPEIMARSGSILREVGTTNKTKISDYEAAINEHTALILKVHPSNYRIIGFTERPEAAELVNLGGRFGIPVVEDLGSGCLLDLSPYGITDEPVVQKSLHDGVDLACFSGDKLLGGPQCGIIVGKEGLIRQIRSNPLMRVLRVDKLTYSALEATLLAYLKEKAIEEIPVLTMIATTKQQIADRAEKFCERLRDAVSEGVHIKTIDGFSVVGGGSCPEVQLPTQLISITSAHLSANQIEKAFRTANTPIITRLEKDQVLIDLRTVLPEQEAIILSACAQF